MNQALNNLDEQTVTLEGEDGNSYVCQILAFFEFEKKEYALLRNIDEPNDNPENTPAEVATVLMQLVQQDDQAIFRTIESDAEFERVKTYIKELAEKAGDEEIDMEEADTGDSNK